MNKEEFWEKWMKQAFGSHIPVRLVQQKEEFLNDLNSIIQYEVDRSIDGKDTMHFPWTMPIRPVIWSSSPTVPGSMLGLGHEWVWPTMDSYVTAYCICNRCGVSSEDKQSEATCIGGITNE